MLLRKNIPAILWTFFIFALCSMPGKSIPKFSWLELISFDKFIHASIFFILQILYMFAFSEQNENMFFKRNYLIFPLVFGIIYGGVLELMQSFVFSERSGDVSDFIANTFGVLTGAVMFKKCKDLLRRFYTLMKI